MKKIFTTITAIMVVVSSSLVLTSWNNDDQAQMAGGAPAGRAGDPANGNSDCTGCHSDYNVTVRTGMITSDIPAQGYTPGNTYTISATISSPLITLFGFENAAQNATGTTDLGTLVPIGTTETQLKTGTYNSVVHKYITHKSSSNTGTGTRTWTYNWIAPVTGSGDVTFYGAFVAADGSGDDTGDSVFVCSDYTVPEYFLGVPAQTKDSKISVFPTVSNGAFTIQNNSANGAAYSLSIYNLAGELVFEKITTSNVENVNLNQPNGLYFVSIKTGNTTTTRKILIQ